jgi:Putative addiction module component
MISTDRMTPQAKMRVLDPAVDDFAKIEPRLTPGKISMISLVGNSLSVENRLTAEILSLPSASRAILADKLIESLEFDIDTDIQSAWSSEAKKRRDEVQDGYVRVISGDDALAQVRNSIDLSNMY